MKFRFRPQILLIAFAACLLFIGMPARGIAQSTCSATDVTALDGGVYNFQMNEYNSSLEECATINGIGFTITTANFSTSTSGGPATYTSIYRGCHWGTCTSSNPFPLQVSNIGSASTSVNITQPGGSQNDAAYDIWFNQSSTTSGQPNGTEIMIWINHQGAPQPFGSDTATASIDGANYQVWTGRQTSWNIVSYVATSPVTSASLNLLPFFNDAVSRGSLESSWWLIDVEYGFEVWTGGNGLAMSGFSVSASAGSNNGGGGGGCTATSITPYLQVNGAAWQNTNSASVASGSTVNLGPQPASGGSWSWSGPNGYSSTSRELDGIPLSSGTDTFVATYTNSGGCKSTETFTITVSGSGGGGGTGTAITPYLQVNGAAWQQTNTATVAPGAKVNLGPQPTSGGSWKWSGPNGYSSTSREIDGIPLNTGANTYTATYTNSSNAKSTETFTITVN